MFGVRLRVAVLAEEDTVDSDSVVVATVETVSKMQAEINELHVELQQSQERLAELERASQAVVREYGLDHGKYIASASKLIEILERIWTRQR
jgi:hypothetical protein